MADYAPNYTVRYRLTYSTLSRTHKVMVRATRGSGAAGAFGARDRLIAALTAIATIRYTDWTVLGGEYSLEDSSFFSPDPAPGAPAAGTAAIPANPKSEGTAHVSFVGTSVGGHKAQFFLYGVGLTPEAAGVTGDDFRVTGAENATVAAAVTALNAGTGIAGNDNNIVTWKNYANAKYNNYYGRRVRRGL